MPKTVPQPKVRRLYRSRSEKVLCGVCGGIADYFGIDPVIVRLFWVLATLVSPPAGILGYIIACVIVPKQPE